MKISLITFYKQDKEYLMIINSYINNPLLQGIVNISIISIIICISSVIIIGQEKKHHHDKHHPLFGKYTINIPNLLSYLRFPLGLLMLLIIMIDTLHVPFMTFIFHLSFGLVCLFDILDGLFARKWHAVTEDGKSLDPAADKWVTFCLAIIAFLVDELRWWGVLIIFTREIMSIIQRHRMKKKGIDVSARWLGKIKTGVQFSVLYIMILRSDVLPGSVFLDLLAKSLSDQLMLWATILMCFCTIISLFPFYQTFSYVNNYTPGKHKNSNTPLILKSLPNILTIGNYLCGITAVYFSMPEVDVAYRPFVVLFWISFAAICDAFDGPLARKFNSYSDFGSCLDSSTDLSTFGLASALIIFLSFSAIKGGSSILGFFIALFYFIHVHLRLARFSKHESEKNDLSSKDDFCGMPSPSGSIAVMILFTFFDQSIIPLSISIIIISILMYSHYQFVSHANTIKIPLYRYCLVPLCFIGFAMLYILIFQQPFIGRHFNRQIIDYFKMTSWVLTIPVVGYILDAFGRTHFTKSEKE